MKKINYTIVNPKQACNYDNDDGKLNHEVANRVRRTMS